MKKVIEGFRIPRESLKFVIDYCVYDRRQEIRNFSFLSIISFNMIHSKHIFELRVNGSKIKKIFAFGAKFYKTPYSLFPSMDKILYALSDNCNTK